MRLYSIGAAQGLKAPIVAKVTRGGVAGEQRNNCALLWDNESPPSDPSGYLAVLMVNKIPKWSLEVPIVHSAAKLDHLAEGDVVAIDPSGLVRTLYRRNSPHNFILLTEQCNSYCLMCSQPPRQIDDSDRMSEHLRLIDLIDPETKEMGITGGEPTLFRDDFLLLIRHCKEKLPNTAVHVLTNGRLFYYRSFARRLAEIAHPNLVLGIPLYSDVDSEHEYVVQATGAFEETVIGLHNLAGNRLPVEIRVVIHRQTYRRLPQLAQFIARNFPFAVHVALMGLEMVGFVHKNLDALWVDPFDYQQQLREATEVLFLAGMNVSIYNHQLCLLPQNLWPFARRSISDWKNIYLDICNPCLVRDQCGGFFQSAAKKHSAFIRPLHQVPVCVTQAIMSESAEQSTLCLGPKVRDQDPR